MHPGPTPLLTSRECAALAAARAAAPVQLECTLDLGRTRSTVAVTEAAWHWEGRAFPFPADCRPRTIYHWSGAAFEPVARYTSSLFKLVPTEWGPPTFEIDGVKMLPTARLSPYADAGQKVALVEPRGKVVLDTCGGLGYFAAWCLHGGAARVLSFEKSADVLWLRTLNPWSPPEDARLRLTCGDIAQEIATMPEASADAILHDPPRFGTAGELYSQRFYDELARVARRNAKLFHYTGTPNKLTSGRDVPVEVARRLQRAGFATVFNGDGVLATRRS